MSFPPDTVNRVVAETFVERVDYHAELASTSSRALEIAREESSPAAVTMVLAERQTAGRGRGDNQWWSGPGALTFSVILPGGPLQLSSGDWPKTSLVAGLAVSDAIEELLDGESPRLKWPNDVFLHGRKVSGILVEAASGQRRMVVIGIGVNVNNSLTDAPDDLPFKAVALWEVTQGKVSRTELLVAILRHLESRLGQLASGVSRWQQDWRRRCLLTGHSIQVNVHNEPLTGVCRGIDEDGALLLETAAGPRRCLSGLVTRIE